MDDFEQRVDVVEVNLPKSEHVHLVWVHGSEMDVWVGGAEQKMVASLDFRLDRIVRTLVAVAAAIAIAVVVTVVVQRLATMLAHADTESTLGPRYPTYHSFYRLPDIAVDISELHTCHA